MSGRSERRSRRERTAREPSKNLLGFEVDGTAYALDLDLVREVVVPQQLTPVPDARPEIAGVADYRGEIVPVIDLRTWLRRAPAPASRRGARWIVLQADGQVVALAVDTVSAPLGLDEQPTSPPRLNDASTARGVSGIATHVGKPLILLDAPGIVRASLGPSEEPSPS